MKSKPRLVKRLRDKVRRNVFTDGTLSGTLGESDYTKHGDRLRFWAEQVTNNMKITLSLCVVGFLFLCGTSFSITSVEQAPRPFTVADEIALTLFGGPKGESPEVHFSPDGSYFAVWTECGRLDLNLVEDSLRFYRSQDVEDFLNRSGEVQPPAPVWVVNRSGKQGRIISDWRWLHDSTGVAFLEGEGYRSDKRLMLADLRENAIEFLTSETEAVKTFDISDRRHYVYTAVGTGDWKQLEDEQHMAAIVGTGRSLDELIFPNDPVYRTFSDRRSKKLWAVISGKRFVVKAIGAPLVPEGALSLSPDGQFLVTKLKVSEVPASWETLYPPSYASDAFNRVHAGSHDVQQYALINLQTGSARALTDAPVSDSAGWFTYGADPVWSSDGQEILLPGTFLRSKKIVPSRPCIAVVDLPTLTSTCVETLKGHTENGGHEEGYHGIHSARFADVDKQRIIVTFHFAGDGSSRGTSEFHRSADGAWRIVAQRQGEHRAEGEEPEVAVEQGFDKPPQLVGTNKRASRVIWDPNPQLRNIELGQVSTYTWSDREGREWRAGLYKPGNYKPGQRYPLVIQGHGFEEFEFRPSGVFPTAFAARALAGAGMVVLQLEDSCPTSTPEEGPCVASGYESAANKLVSDGLVDRDNIGIIGFSRTCFYVMETLTFGSLRIKAASITDGVMGGYPEYILLTDLLASDSNSLIGASPFGEGLRQWLKRSPGFNLEKVTAPLLVVGAGPYSLLYMWQPYSGLHYLKKPVDLIMLNTREHVLTNPAERMASQGGSVDWFRFWLKGEEDSDPTKGAQYARWRELRRLQAENERKAPTDRPSSN
jgi:dipeptidyl aminopeptidase/acylaminoacyl peptidase